VPPGRLEWAFHALSQAWPAASSISTRPFLYGTNPLLWDTDGDGFSDSDELAQGTDPSDPASHPVVYLPAMGGAVGIGVLMLGLSGLGWAMLMRSRSAGSTGGRRIHRGEPM
jgi:hypothetical protein